MVVFSGDKDEWEHCTKHPAFSQRAAATAANLQCLAAAFDNLSDSNLPCWWKLLICEAMIKKKAVSVVIDR